MYGNNTFQGYPTTFCILISQIATVFATVVFLLVITLLNWYNFELDSFCIMNPREPICEFLQVQTSCASRYPTDNTVMNYFDGYAGFFIKPGDAKNGSCFFDLGANSTLKFTHLDFGSGESWSESNFVLIDGEFAAFRPKTDFNSDPTMIFNWIIKELDLDIFSEMRKIRTGLVIMNSPSSNIQLYYNHEEMKGRIIIIRITNCYYNNYKI